MKDVNFVFLHVESPDEAGHEGNIDYKVKAIEDFDEMIVGRVLNALEAYDDFSILVMPDHPTPISIKSHTADPVPFCIFSNRTFEEYQPPVSAIISGFNEISAKATGFNITEGHKLIEIIINNRF